MKHPESRIKMYRARPCSRRIDRPSEVQLGFGNGKRREMDGKYKDEKRESVVTCSNIVKIKIETK